MRRGSARPALAGPPCRQRHPNTPAPSRPSRRHRRLLLLEQSPRLVERQPGRARSREPATVGGRPLRGDPTHRAGRRHRAALRTGYRRADEDEPGGPGGSSLLPCRRTDPDPTHPEAARLRTNDGIDPKVRCHSPVERKSCVWATKPHCLATSAPAPAGAAVVRDEGIRTHRWRAAERRTGPVRSRRARRRWRQGRLRHPVRLHRPPCFRARPGPGPDRRLPSTQARASPTTAGRSTSHDAGSSAADLSEAALRSGPYAAAACPDRPDTRGGCQTAAAPPRRDGPADPPGLTHIGGRPGRPAQRKRAAAPRGAQRGTYLREAPLRPSERLP
jgi:hypothetical protein